MNGALALRCSLIATGVIMRPLEIGVKMRPPFCQVCRWPGGGSVRLAGAPGYGSKEASGLAEHADGSRGTGGLNAILEEKNSGGPHRGARKGGPAHLHGQWRPSHQRWSRRTKPWGQTRASRPRAAKRAARRATCGPPTSWRGRGLIEHPCRRRTGGAVRGRAALPSYGRSAHAWPVKMHIHATAGSGSLACQCWARHATRVMPPRALSIWLHCDGNSKCTRTDGFLLPLGVVSSSSNDESAPNGGSGEMVD
eukprot:scaffold18115_cov112-Isochrysis_galbana.AAC.3